MTKLLFILFIGFGAFIYLSKTNTVEPLSTASVNKAPIKVKKIKLPKVSYKCDGRQHCSQMSSYMEAKYFIEHCPNTKMDGDNDGIPCERQFGK